MRTSPPPPSPLSGYQPNRAVENTNESIRRRAFGTAVACENTSIHVVSLLVSYAVTIHLIRVGLYCIHTRSMTSRAVYYSLSDFFRCMYMEQVLMCAVILETVGGCLAVKQSCVRYTVIKKSWKENAAKCRYRRVMSFPAVCTDIPQSQCVNNVSSRKSRVSCVWIFS